MNMPFEIFSVVLLYCIVRPIFTEYKVSVTTIDAASKMVQNFLFSLNDVIDKRRAIYSKTFTFHRAFDKVANLVLRKITCQYYGFISISIMMRNSEYSKKKHQNFGIDHFLRQIKIEDQNISRSS